MAYQVISGEIAENVLYVVAGEQTVTYNAVDYGTGDNFRGVADQKTFTYSGSGTQEVNEVFELRSGGIRYVETGVDQPVFPEQTKFAGMAIEFALNDAEKVVQEVTKIQGFALEVIDYPFYVFEIIETRP